MDWHKGWESSGPSDKLISIRNIKESPTEGVYEQETCEK